MKVNNLEVRKAIEAKRLKYFELAHALGIDRVTLWRWLNFELDPDKKETILKAIEEYKI